ncbi:hypothetical protein DTL42_00835 [Bremerella cremea]|uniref:Aspartate/glutamate/uridylate kinase domain-containing protein n=1 Tax=Bremerella cremea TaxID=1031537 RepID=A0A368KXI9_9BACT|nr:hypothetical protein [Bremerella cremea]RCS55968.1 hypothetical protein DTL42_00835 [Bremerella cremea]
MSLVVWKLGGSLFDLPDLAQRIRRLKAECYADFSVVIIPGGGEFADVVRRLDQNYQLSARDSHCLALEAMRINARMVANLLGESAALADPDQQQKRLQTWHASEDTAKPMEVWDVINTWNLCLPALEERIAPIPEDWTLTSDSIAALLAWYWQADRLVLCKSIDAPTTDDVHAWAKQGLVDLFFPQIAPHLPCIEWVNLRAQ